MIFIYYFSRVNMLKSLLNGLMTGRRLLTYLALAVMLFAVSCTSQKSVIQWNVELQESNLPITNRCDPNQKLTSIKSADKPQLIPATEDREARVRVEGIPCEPKEDPPIYELPVTRVKRITYVSDPLSPPIEILANNLTPIEGCCRVRDGWLFFDKFELKASIGYRGTKDSVIYSSAGGQTVYNSSLINFDRGGSTLTFGLELDGLWNLKFIDPSGRLQGGIFLGAWPVDEAIFVPVGLNLRYTLNQTPAKYSDHCNSWYFYGNAGLPFDFQTHSPTFNKDWKFQRRFYGLGVGYDIAVSCSWDLSIDLGYRFMNLPLPEITCCPQIPLDERFPHRASDVLLLRVGVTF
jgi:hypothetical protein